MSLTVTCQACGKNYAVRSEHAGKTFRCKNCGEVMPPAEPEQQQDDSEYQLAPSDDSAQQPQQMDPGLSIANEQRASQTCSNCGANLPHNAVICVSCGLNLRTGQRLGTVVEGVSERFNVQLPFAVQILCIIAGMVSLMIATGVWFAPPAAGESRTATMMLVIVFALLTLTFLSLGFWNKKYVDIERKPGEKGVLSTTRWLGFLRLRREAEIGDYDTVCFIQRPMEVGSQTFLILLAVGLLFVGVVPGLVFWYFILKSDDTSIRYRAELRGKARKRFVIHWGGETAKADVDEIVKLVHATTGLKKEQELGLLD